MCVCVCVASILSNAQPNMGIFILEGTDPTRVFVLTAAGVVMP